LSPQLEYVSLSHNLACFRGIIPENSITHVSGSNQGWPAGS
jgi:hypothetical protein